MRCTDNMLADKILVDKTLVKITKEDNYFLLGFFFYNLHYCREQNNVKPKINFKGVSYNKQ